MRSQSHTHLQTKSAMRTLLFVGGQDCACLTIELCLSWMRSDGVSTNFEEMGFLLLFPSYAVPNIPPDH